LVASTKELPRLQFKNPVFHDGVNVTVRHGDKWLHKVAVGDRVQIAQTDGDDLGEAMVCGLLYLPARLIPQEVLDLEHDPKCKTHKGLFAVLKEVYPDFSEHSACTVVLFCDPESLDHPAPPKPKAAKSAGKGKGKGGGGGKPAGKPEGGKPEGTGEPEKQTEDKDAPDPAPKPDEGEGAPAGDGEKSQG